MGKKHLKHLKQMIAFLLVIGMGVSGIRLDVRAEAKETKPFVYDISFEEISTGNLNFGEDNDQNKRGQAFVAVEGGKLCSVDVSIGRLEEAGGDLVAELYAIDPVQKRPTGDVLATGNVSKEMVPVVNRDTGSGLGVVNISLKYDSLTKGQMYMVVLSQDSYVGGYRWSASCDITNPNWWHENVMNPQVTQEGYDGELPSLKFEKNGNIVDESRCGDLWMKVNYAKEFVYDISFVEINTGNLNFGENSDQNMRGQTFMALNGGSMKSIEVSIGKVPGTTGAVVAQLYEFDLEQMIPVGNKLAEAKLDADCVTEFDQVSETGVDIVSIPLQYDALEKGKMYIVKLGQETLDKGYRWSASCDVTNPNWWHDDIWNPQVSQAGFGDNLPSLKFKSDGTIVDESRCGDLWLKVHYDLEYEPEEKNQEPNPEPEESSKNLAERYEEDMENGGLSFYMDRVLARPGIDPSLIEDSGLMTRGKSLYTKGTNTNGLITEFGFGGTMRYIKGDQTGYTIQINGQKASQFTEETAKRTDYPSYWTSSYKGKSNSDNAGLNVVTRRFITDNNVAVTILYLTNATSEPMEVNLDVLTGNKYKVIDQDTLGGTIRVDYRNIDVKLSADGGTAREGKLTGSIEIKEGETVSWKAQMGFVDPKKEEAVDEYESIYAADAEDIFRTQVQEYNAWWVENIPYLEVPDEAIQKMIAYRWWIARMNMADIGSTNYPFPTAMEGVFGYNNAIVNAVPWQMDEMRYLRSPLAEYGTWADAAIAANGGIYWDNPAGLWGVKPQHYISQAGWESYKVHGGQMDFLKAMADAGAGDVLMTREIFDSDGDYLYDIQYDAWDADTVSLARTGTQERIDTAALAWANAVAVSNMYRAAGEGDKADEYSEIAEQIKETNVSELWDTDSNQFLMRVKNTGEFNTLRDINNYYAFMVGMIPANEGYDEALRVWGDEEEFPMWPMYISNSKDYYTTKSTQALLDRSRNYSPGSFAITLKMFGTVIDQYDADNITGTEYGELLKNYTNISYNNYDLRYPDTNEFFNHTDGSVPENGHYRSWIHHDWHSQYNTLIIEDVMGMVPREDKIVELNPIDIGWDSFTAENINYHGFNLTIKWEKDQGYRLYLEGKEVAAVDKLCHFTWNAETGEVKVLDDSQALVITNKTESGFKTAFDIIYTEGALGSIMTTMASYQPGDIVVPKDDLPNTPEKPEYDASYLIQADDWEDNWNLDFGEHLTNDQYKRAQMFVATENGTMTGVQVMIQNNKATGDVTVQLYDDSANGKPGKALAETTIPAADVSSGNMTIVTAELTYQLEAGHIYYIVLGQEGTGSGGYKWVLSSKNSSTPVQCKQNGYDGDLSIIKIKGNPSIGDGERVDESSLGDHYLEVFYRKAKSTPDTADLRAEVEKAEAIKAKLNDYEEIGKEDFEKALAAAQAILQNPESTEQIENAIKVLQAAIQELVLKKTPADTSALDKAAEDARKIDASKYTVESYAKVIKALDALALVDRYDQKAVDAAAKALREAIAQLVEKVPVVLQIPKKNTIHQNGALVYKVIKSAAKNGTVSVVRPVDKNCTNIVIPKTVKLNGYTFKVTEIAKKAFKNKKKLKKVKIGDNVTKIRKQAFASCKNLVSINMGKGLETIESKAFYKDKALKKVKIRSTKLKKVYKNSLKGIYKKALIDVPDKKRAKYKSILKKAGLPKTVTIK